MGAKRVFCTIFYLLFSLIFTGILVCDVTGALNHFNLLPNNFITTTINTNLITPIYTAINGLGLLDSLMLANIIYIFITIVGVLFWFFCVVNFANILRNASTKGTSVGVVIFSIIMLVVLAATIALTIRSGASIQTILSNYYLIGQIILYFLALIIGILSLTITQTENITAVAESESEPQQLSPQQREDRIKQILGDDEIDPRV